MMRTSRDVVFDESHHFYPRSTTDASPISLVDPLSFLLFPDAPPASLPIHRSTLPSSASSSESPSVVLEYTVKLPVTQFYSCHGARLSDALAFSDELSSDVTSSSFFEDVSSSPPVEPSSPEQLVRCSHRLRRPPDYYSPSASQPLFFLSQLLITMLFFIQNSSMQWLRRLLLFNGLARGILCHVPHIFV
jgi:hypothetical protein